ncbi:MAG: acetylglutamate kinase [Proteobacteria bacterium]|nr:acetylglutamate kinase [Pseudomonadota bacterium]
MATTTKKIGDTKHWLRTAATIMEALPNLRRFSGKTFVIKYGGHAMGDVKLAKAFANDIVLIKQVGINPVIVHGGGPQIGDMLERLKIKSSFVDGLRVTDQDTMGVVEMVLSGRINKQIVSSINAAGGRAIGLSGKDGRLIEAGKLRRARRNSDSNIEKVPDLGFVGEPTRINPDILSVFAKSDMIPVIAPIGVGADGETYNINADTVAGAVAQAIGAAKLVILTDVKGVVGANGELISRIGAEQARALLEDGAITGGMIPKLETCLAAVDSSIEAAHILDGRVPHVLLLEIFTKHGTGTMIEADGAASS